MVTYQAVLNQCYTEYNKESKDWSGDTYDGGDIQTFKACTLQELLNKIQKVYDLTTWTLVDDEPNRLETNFIDSMDNDTLVDFSLYFSKVEHTNLSITNIFKKKAV